MITKNTLRNCGNESSSIEFPIDAENILMPDGQLLNEVGEEWEFLLDDGTIVKKKVMIANV